MLRLFPVFCLWIASPSVCVRAETPLEPQPGLAVSSLGRLEAKLKSRDEADGTDAKRDAVMTLTGLASDSVVLSQVAADLGGNTSIRNQSPLVWKDKGYFRRCRDLGQVFTAPRDFSLRSLILRTGNGSLAYTDGTAGAGVFVQFFAVDGEPTVNDNGTPSGTAAKHGFSTNHRCDDYLNGVSYRPLVVVEGGTMPKLSGEGKLTYLRFDFAKNSVPVFREGKRYAFMVGFSEPAPDRNFTLANRNKASSPRPPVLNDAHDPYPGGWGLRREGNGENPPLKIPGANPPNDSETVETLRKQAKFPSIPSTARYAITPTCEGYPDVDTYRDLEFLLVASEN